MFNRFSLKVLRISKHILDHVDPLYPFVSRPIFRKPIQITSGFNRVYIIRTEKQISNGVVNKMLVDLQNKIQLKESRETN